MFFPFIAENEACRKIDSKTRIKRNRESYRAENIMEEKPLLLTQKVEGSSFPSVLDEANS
jgi:hypothetical protein